MAMAKGPPVDDLVDSGNTAKVIRELYPKAKLITIFAQG